MRSRCRSCTRRALVESGVQRWSCGAATLALTVPPGDRIAIRCLAPRGQKSPHPALWSLRAVCNEIYYRTLRAVRANLIVPRSSRRRHRGLLMPVLFVHLPPPNASSIAESAQFVRSIAARMVQPA